MHIYACVCVWVCICVCSVHRVQKRAPDALEPELHVVWMWGPWELKLGARVRRCSQALSRLFSPIDKTQTQRKSKGRGLKDHGKLLAVWRHLS